MTDKSPILVPLTPVQFGVILAFALSEHSTCTNPECAMNALLAAMAEWYRLEYPGELREVMKALENR